MADMEKVIKEIKAKITYAETTDQIYSDAVRVRLLKAVLELLKEQEEQIKKRDESLEKAREEIKWLRGMLKEQEAVKPQIDAFGLPYCPKCKTLVYNTWEFCPHCGLELKWE